ncbi:MAG TPA: hypothetical protein VEW91_02070 [bacterium]|nr:hypothetical protein [bacterium]
MSPSHSVGYARALLAGGAAGVVASVVCLGVRVVLPKPGPPPEAVAGSAFVAGVLGGLVFGWWDRVVRRPGLALWITSVALATLTSAFVAMLPAPATRISSLFYPVAGLVFYLEQAAALVGIGRFASFHVSGSYILADTVLHYVTAIAVSLLVPLWARPAPRAP